MTKELVVGILGGMGPEATLTCFGNLIQNSRAKKDQDHLKIVIVNDPKIPDRTNAITGNGVSPLPALKQGISALKKAGADFAIIPCVTAHFFLNDLLKQSELPILSILDAAAEDISKHHPEIKKIGLIGTSGTIESRIFQDRLEKEGVETIVCSKEEQHQVMAAIYDIKSRQPGRSRSQITLSLQHACDSLVAKGAQGIIAGCTEIPLALCQEDLSLPYFDTLLILARKAIGRAGLLPNESQK